jgi:hypothetical protein
MEVALYRFICDNNTRSQTRKEQFSRIYQHRNRLHAGQID